jgi:hypothetical protein
MADTLYELLTEHADRELIDYAARTVMVSGTPVLQLRPQGDVGEPITYWSVAGNTVTPTTQPAEGAFAGPFTQDT